MAMKVRRIVTGHNAAGKAVVKTDEQITAGFETLLLPNPRS